eukprot:CAMPEP_0171909246 /NCGR_PEP_ID=MMETSP0993-20121228/8618_1 /TAXON_ID=483369 /ORGANISM="non described non described, Strain CCMP2098" /LENGTH=210 /DNA_ID=CAMNT_0012542187 /DNA_START=28 /DNA_END=661 /DNA_ORIENTATION=-
MKALTILLGFLLELSHGFEINPRHSFCRHNTIRHVIDRNELKDCLSREYTGFFDPMEVEFYDPEVSFLDPLTALTGVQSYKANIDLLAGRNPLGAWLFKDAGIALHSVADTGPYSVRTRWTLQLTMHALPWHPTAYFTGVSDYTLSEGSGVIVAQRDYWDSLNLEAGSYTARSKVEGLLDFVAQLSPSNPERFTGLCVGTHDDDDDDDDS